MQAMQSTKQNHRTASVLKYIESCELPTPWARFRSHVFVEPATGKEHLALALGEITGDRPVLVRIHSECLTGDALFSQRCDCAAQLEHSMRLIAAEGRGLLIYLRQEGRGIGLANKIRAYRMQDLGADTVDANVKLGFAPDQRNYALCQPILSHFGIGRIHLMTNNPDKVEAIRALGITVIKRVPVNAGMNPFNRRYLETKALKLNHDIPISDTCSDRPKTSRRASPAVTIN